MLPVVIDGASLQLETLMIAPPSGGRHPIALIAHGVPRDKDDIDEMTPSSGAIRAEVFARNGYAAFIVMRRGYGLSAGEYSERNGRCDRADYAAAARETAADLRAAVDAIRRRPDVDPNAILLVGQSGGGFGALALGADPPAGVRAVINLAGGRGSSVAGQCSEEKLLQAFASFGRGAKTPSLWIYAANDKFFPAPLAERFFKAFQDAGGKGVWAPAPAYGEDGHRLSSRRDGVALWGPMVERFLVQNQLPAAPGASMEITKALKAAPPLSLGEKGREGWAKYLNSPPFSAFAATRDGAHWGLATAKRSEDEARRTALSYCKGPCQIYAVNGL